MGKLNVGKRNHRGIRNKVVKSQKVSWYGSAEDILRKGQKTVGYDSIPPPSGPYRAVKTFKCEHKSESRVRAK